MPKLKYIMSPSGCLSNCELHNVELEIYDFYIYICYVVKIEQS